MLLEMIDGNAPDFLLARMVFSVWLKATAMFGAMLYQKMGEDAIENARRGHGLCQTCDAEIDACLTHPPYCLQCEQRNREQVEEITKVMEEET